MRTIEISTDVFATLWALRRPGEDSESDILARVFRNFLSPAPEAVPPVLRDLSQGYYDRRHNVTFEEGMEIFRIFRGVEYRAQASGGRWVLLNTGHAYKSLNALSRAVGARTENAWINWFYLNDRGERRRISELRAAYTIAHKS